MNIPLFVMDELKKALGQLSNLRCCDDDGITAEMIKYSSETMKIEILTHFNKAPHFLATSEKLYGASYQQTPQNGVLY